MSDPNRPSGPPPMPPATPPPTGPPSVPQPSASSRAVVALVMGIAGLICCGFFAPVAWILGSLELKAIRAGEAPSQGHGLAVASLILGIIGTALLALALLWVVFFGGLAIIQGIAEST